MTMPVNTKQESRREIAERIAEKYFPSQSLTQNGELTAEIESTLKERDERAARIVETVHVNTMFAVGLREVIAAAIRKDKHCPERPELALITKLERLIDVHGKE